MDRFSSSRHHSSYSHVHVLICLRITFYGTQIAEGVDATGSPWGSLYQRAFFIPIELIDEAWEWSKANRRYVDIVKHPNSGCMTDDHRLRRVWDGTEHTIYTLQFPCNMPATGCLDADYPDPPSCGCAVERKSDAPEDSCENCVQMGILPPRTNLTVLV